MIRSRVTWPLDVLDVVEVLHVIDVIRCCLQQRLDFDVF
jgi:hypothetical protein